MRNLKYAQRDAQLMRDYFKKEANFEEVFYFADDSEPILAPNGDSQETKPTYRNLSSFFNDFFEQPKLDTGDNFWLFFSGHGMQLQGEHYLVPADANPRLITSIILTIDKP